jgi:hypothetical protein
MKTQQKIKRFAFRVSIGLLVLMVVLLCLVFAIFNPKRSLLYKIGDSYKGWVVVRYDDPSCAPLDHENIFLVIPVSSSGRGCTSSPPPEGWRYNRYEYLSQGKVTRAIPQSGWGGKGEIWAGFTMPAEHSESFFVGTEQELNKSWSSRPGKK